MPDVSMDPAAANAARDEVGELYAALAVRLHQIVYGRVRAPEPVIEDACQFAWCTLIRYQGRVRRDRALGWLATTASREALRQVRRHARERSLEQLAEDG